MYDGCPIFFSCKEENNFYGFKGSERFKVYYSEIPVESSVLLFDSLRTSNSTFTGENNRFLVGTYSDPKFGSISSTAYTQFFTAGPLQDDSLDLAFFDSVTLHLRFDLYNYGSISTSDQDIAIFELEQELKRDSLKYYFNKSTTPWISTALGTKSFSIDPATFNKFIEDKKDTVIKIKIPLNFNFGKRIMESVVKLYQHTDSTFYHYEDFVKEFKGLAIVPTQGDKIIGFSPSYSQSKITLHYHINKRDSIDLSFAGLVGYSGVQADRSSTPLAGLQYFQPFSPADDLRYIQSGTGVFTKLDFSKYLEFVDSIKHPDPISADSFLIINAAELVIGGVETVGNFAPPKSLVLRLLKDNNRLKAYSAQRATDQLEQQLYIPTLSADFEVPGQQAVIVENDTVFTVGSELSRMVSFPYSTTTNSYTGDLTFFIQELFQYEKGKPKFKNFVLYPSNPAAAKSMNRVTFLKDNIKLKIYYTRPNHK